MKSGPQRTSHIPQVISPLRLASRGSTFLQESGVMPIQLELTDMSAVWNRENAFGVPVMHSHANRTKC